MKGKGIIGKVKGIVVAFLAAALISTSFSAAPEPVYADFTDEAQNYELGEEYSGNVANSHRYFKFTLPNKCRLEVNVTKTNADCTEVLDALGKVVIRREDILYQDVLAADESVMKGGVGARVLPAGTYYLHIWAGYDLVNYSFHLQAEDQIFLNKGKIASLTSDKKGKATLVCEKEPDAIGYIIKYASNPKFTKNLQVVEWEDGETFTATGLKRKKAYYFKITPFNVYDDGGYVYGKTSAVKKIKIK